MVQQHRTWLTCQFCGRVTSADDADHWLNQPHRETPLLRIVRCPQHWSEWALRNTREGRTKRNRERMEGALSQPEPLMPPHVSPYPTIEQDEA